jgi:chorismate-pyruvate lyase
LNSPSLSASSARLPLLAGEDLAIYPLNEFYARTRTQLPAFEVIPGSDIAEPYRSLLVHDRDMTPTLESYHRADIHIEVLSRERRGEEYFREVILRRDGDDRPVEFGANRIALDRLPAVVRRLVLQEYLPFGHILKAHEFEHTGHPTAYFRIASDTLINRAFGLEERRVLYGRRNTLRDMAGRPISDVVEILPPL